MIFSPLVGNDSRRPVSGQTPSRFGPRHCGQSAPWIAPAQRMQNAGMASDLNISARCLSSLRISISVEGQREAQSTPRRLILPIYCSESILPLHCRRRPTWSGSIRVPESSSMWERHLTILTRLRSWAVCRPPPWCPRRFLDPAVACGGSVKPRFLSSRPHRDPHEGDSGSRIGRIERKTGGHPRGTVRAWLLAQDQDPRSARIPGRQVV